MAAVNPAIPAHGHEAHDDHDHKPHGFLHRWRYRRPSTGFADSPTFSTPARFNSSMTV